MKANPTCVGCKKTSEELGWIEGYANNGEAFLCPDCFHAVPVPPPRWSPSRFISWCMRLDHWTRKPLLFIAGPLALAGALFYAIPNGRAFTFAFWDLEWRMWWVAWDGLLIGRDNRTTWPGQR